MTDLAGARISQPDLRGGRVITTGGTTGIGSVIAALPREQAGK